MKYVPWDSPLVRHLCHCICAGIAVYSPSLICVFQQRWGAGIWRADPVFFIGIWDYILLGKVFPIEIFIEFNNKNNVRNSEIEHRFVSQLSITLTITLECCLCLCEAVIKSYFWFSPNSSNASSSLRKSLFILKKKLKCLTQSVNNVKSREISTVWFQNVSCTSSLDFLMIYSILPVSNHYQLT